MKKGTNGAGGVKCLVCHRKLKRRKYRKTRIGPTCQKKLESGFAGIQIDAFTPCRLPIKV